MCAAQKIYKPSSRCQQNICQGLVLGARVVIFTAALTLELGGAPLSPLGAGHGPVRVIGL